MHHTSISSVEQSWSIPVMDPYKEAALQAPEQALPLPDYVPGPEYPEYLAPSNNEIPRRTLRRIPLIISLMRERMMRRRSPYGDDGGGGSALALAESTYLLDFILTLLELWISVRPHTPPSPSTKALIAEFASPTPPSPPPSPSPLSPWSSPFLQVPSLPLPLPSPPLLLPSTTHRTDIPEAEMPPQKRSCFTALSHSIRASKGRMMTTVDEVNGRITDLATTHRQDVEEIYMHHQDAQTDIESEAMYAREAWSHSEGRSTALEAFIMT
ncbi:hypothetical protein Tco_0999992 [Tanacetum coccineum]